MKSSYRFFTFCCFILCTCTNSAKAVVTIANDTSSKTTSGLPILGFGYGAQTFIGDIGNSYVNTPFAYRGAFQFEVQLQSKSNFEIFFHLLSGKVLSEEKTLSRNVNFKSSIFMGGANIRYAFHFKKYPDQVLIPFISAGIESVSYNPYTDLKDANGNTYYYWTDGTIRNMDETSSDASQAKVLHRDYNYETNVRDSNIDSLGKFNQMAVAFPLSIGVKFRISGRVALHLTETYHLTTTDYIDGITSESLGMRKGESGNDKILYSSISFHYNLAAPRETKKVIHTKADMTKYNSVNYEYLQKEDADGDGVVDFLDEDNSTSSGAKVDPQGRALDSDGDGVADYRDKEPNSTSRTFVDENGVTITDSTQEAKYIQDSLNMEMTRIAERVKTKNEYQQGTAENKSNLPNEFKVVDTNSDGVISADEIATAIDLYTAGKSPFTKKQFYSLVDYFFAQ